MLVVEGSLVLRPPRWSIGCPGGRSISAPRARPEIAAQAACRRGTGPRSTATCLHEAAPRPRGRFEDGRPGTGVVHIGPRLSTGRRSAPHRSPLALSVAPVDEGGSHEPHGPIPPVGTAPAPPRGRRAPRLGLAPDRSAAPHGRGAAR